MLQIKNLNIFLREDFRLIIKDFSFTLNSNDKVGLIGEEGNGKSILLKTIYDRNNVEEFCDIEGEIFTSNDVIGYLPQILDNKLMMVSAEEYMLKSLNNELDYDLFYKNLYKFKMDDSLIFTNKKLKELSGGQRVKFLLFVEMLKNPTVLLIDEPSNDLDFESLLWLENFMKNIEIPIIFVSHDTYLLSKVANKIIHIEQTHRRTKTKFTISNNNYDEYLEKRSNFIDKETKIANKEQKEFSKKINRYNSIYNSVNHALRNTKSNNPCVGKNLKDKMHAIKSMGKILDKEKGNLREKPNLEESIDIFFDDNIEVPNSKVILDLDIEKLEIENRILSRNIKLKIIGSEKICIIGKNGVGKTTLVKFIMKNLEKLNLRVGYMPQNYSDLQNYNLTAIEFLSKDYTKDEHTKISKYLGSLNFKREEMYRNIKDLSGGQKAKLFFAKMNLDKAEVLILDEPTRNLSPLSQTEIIEALQKYKGAIISISHDRNFINQITDKIYRLDESGLKILDRF